MPITVNQATPALTLYYALVGNNNKSNPRMYRSHNPWQTAKRFCGGLGASHAALVASVATLDDSVYQVALQPAALQGQTIDSVAQTLLNDLATAVAPLANGDRLVAVVPDGGLLKEIVHHTP